MRRVHFVGARCGGPVIGYDNRTFLDVRSGLTHPGAEKACRRGACRQITRTRCDESVVAMASSLSLTSLVTSPAVGVRNGGSGAAEVSLEFHFTDYSSWYGAQIGSNGDGADDVNLYGKGTAVEERPRLRSEIHAPSQGLHIWPSSL